MQNAADKKNSVGAQTELKPANPTKIIVDDVELNEEQLDIISGGELPGLNKPS